MKGTKKLAWLGLLLVLPVLAQATTVTYSALTVRELGNFLMNLPTGFYAIAPAAATAPTPTWPFDHSHSDSAVVEPSSSTDSNWLI